MWPLDQQHIVLPSFLFFSPIFLSVSLPLCLFLVEGRSGVKIPKPMIQVFTKGVWTMTYTSLLPHMSTVRNVHTHTHTSSSPAQSLWHSALLRQLLIYLKRAPIDLLPGWSKLILLGNYRSMRLPHIHACVVCSTNTHKHGLSAPICQNPTKRERTLLVFMGGFKLT